MTENFKVVKNKYKKLAIISAIALGVFCGVTVACALLLAFKLSAIEFLWVYYVLIGVGAAAICAVPFYFLLRPNDKKLAVKLDRQFCLNQKVQTMVEFASEQGTMVTLQREQTDEALSVAAKKPADVKGLLKFIFIPVMAIAVACVGIIMPARKTIEILPQFTLTQAHRTAINNVIADINASELSDGLKVATSTALSDLLTELADTTLQSEMKRKVKSTIRGIDSIIASANSYLPLYRSLKNDEFTKPFAIAMVRSVAYYKTASTSTIKSFGAVAGLIEISNDSMTDTLIAWKDGVKETFYNAPEEEGAAKTLMTSAEMAERASGYSSAFNAGLQNAEFNGENDLLCTAIKNFASEIGSIDSNWGPEYYLNTVGEICEAFISPSCEDALSVQTYNCLMDEYIRNRTAEIFGLKLSEIGENTNVVPELTDELGGDGDELEGGDGFGGGGIEYAGDDMVLDPDSGELVNYGTLISRYRAKIEERKNEFERLASKEDATEEEKAEAKYVKGELSRYVTQYLSILENGSESKQ